MSNFTDNQKVTIARLAHEAAYWNTGKTNEEFFNYCTAAGIDTETMGAIYNIAKDNLAERAAMYYIDVVEILNAFTPAATDEAPADGDAPTNDDAPAYAVGDLVIIDTVAQRTSRRGATNAKGRKVMEVGSIEWRTALPYSDEVDGWGYRLRRPGSTTKGGQVCYAEAAITRYEA